jgi:Calcineurin-like phosphoesterase
VVVAAGDIACDPEDVFFNGGLGDATHCQMNATAQTATSLRPSTVLALGDIQYNAATMADFRAVYDLNWGQLKSITHPVPGNHEYGSPGATGYLSYFGAAAAPAGTTWYSFDLGSWHVVALDSNCDQVGGCGPSSPQGDWLAADLAANPTLCTLALWHHPAFSSARGGGIDGSKPLWNMAVAGGVDLVLNGHRHQYERIAALGTRGSADPARGTREIVVGTGGNDLETFGPAIIGSEVRLATFGVLELTLAATGYTFRFVGIDGSTLDQGNGACQT